jgi:hypothetical protein
MHRLDVYYKETIPLLDFYGQKKNVLQDFTILRGLEDMPKLEQSIVQGLSAREQ